MKRFNLHNRLQHVASEFCWIRVRCFDGKRSSFVFYDSRSFVCHSNTVTLTFTKVNINIRVDVVRYRCLLLLYMTETLSNTYCLSVDLVVIPTCLWRETLSSVAVYDKLRWPEVRTWVICNGICYDSVTTLYIAEVAWGFSSMKVTFSKWRSSHVVSYQHQTARKIKVVMKGRNDQALML